MVLIISSDVIIFDEIICVNASKILSSPVHQGWISRPLLLLVHTFQLIEIHVRKATIVQD